MIGSPHSRTLEDEIISVTDHQLLMAPFVKSRPGSALAGADRPGLIVVVRPVIAGPGGDRCRLRRRGAGPGGPAPGRLEKDQPRQAPRQPPIGAEAARQAAGRQPGRTRRYHVPAGSARVTAAATLAPVPARVSVMALPSFWWPPAAKAVLPRSGISVTGSS